MTDVTPTPPETKPWFTSKTLWVNIIAGGAAVAAALGLDIGLDAEAQAGLVTGILAVANIILRFMTSKAIGS